MSDTKVTKDNLQEFAELFHAKNKTLYAEKAVEETINGIQTDVAAIKQAYGTPLVAATAAAMTDQTKIYVYAGSETGYTAGNWYYYNGSAWTSGGTYNSTAFNADTTLSIAGAAADAKKTGDEISGLKDACVKKNGEKEVTVQNTNFLDVVWINLFDGNYVDGKAIQGSGSSASGFTYVNNSARYNLVKIPVKPNTKYTICGRQTSDIDIFRIVTATQEIEVGNHFDGGVAISLDLHASKYVYTVTTGANDHFLYFYGLNYDSNTRPFVQICEGEISDFTTDQYGDNYGIPNDKLRIQGTDGGVIIKPVSSTRFNVLIMDRASKEWMTHTFVKTYTTHTLNGQSVVTSDVWWAEWIKDAEGNNIMQGNTNYIHYLNMQGHAGHVGAGHGCAVAVWTLFFADGSPFDPTTLDHEIKCSCFRMTEKVNHYLIDEINTTSSSDAIPTLDGSGNPIIESVEYLDAEWTENNRMKIRNRLDIVMDGLQFAECFAGMLTGYYPYFDNIIINNPEYIYNGLSGTGQDIVATNKGGTPTVLSKDGGGYWDADEVILYGDKYRATARIIANDPLRHSKLNVETASIPPNYDNRIKAYFMPCVCTESYPLIAKGETVETFNTGSILDVMILRTLDISE